MSLFHVQLYSHNFTVSKVSPVIRHIIDSFIRKFVQFGLVKNEFGKWVYKPIRVFASSTKDRRFYRFHINSLKIFKEHLEQNGVIESSYSVERIPLYQPVEALIPLFPKWQPREHQKLPIEYLLSPQSPVSKFVDMQTGDGKTFTSCYVVSKLNQRVAIVVRSQYVEKWNLDVQNLFNINPDNILVIRGLDSLKELIRQAVSGELKACIYIISNRTMQMWIKLYEECAENILDMGYCCLPQDLYQALGVGTRMIDEVHQDFHLNFKIDTYTHVPNSISLSATLLGDDPFINKMYEVAYPTAERYKGPAYRRFVNSTAVIYEVKQPNKLRYKDYSRKTYSHIVYEQSIMRNPGLLNNYFEMIGRLVIEYYEIQSLENRGDRCLVYCASIEMSTLLTTYLKKKFLHRDVRRYVEDDPYENLLDSEICVSTLLSAGTAIDIPGLITVILTVAIKSSQGNVQGLGRLREIEGRKLNFVYLVCESIGKHIDYHERKKVILENRALNMRTVYYPNPL